MKKGKKNLSVSKMTNSLNTSPRLFIVPQNGSKRNFDFPIKSLVLVLMNFLTDKTLLELSVSANKEIFSHAIFTNCSARSLMCKRSMQLFKDLEKAMNYISVGDLGQK